jgi:murein DD-endopeptidase MepM/ murein hydrolase activator NlpD
MLVLGAILPLLLAATAIGSPSRPVVAPDRPTAVPGAGTWAWPVRGPVIGVFEPPETPFGSGHRGIDVAAALGTVVVAPAAGLVAFSGPVGGRLFVTLDHGGGLTTTYSWLSATLVRAGDVVPRGAPIARTGEGHPGSSRPHLHLGVRLDGAYLDPMELLEPMSVSDFIRLAPLSDAA